MRPGEVEPRVRFLARGRALGFLLSSASHGRGRGRRSIHLENVIAPLGTGINGDVVKKAYDISKPFL